MIKVKVLSCALAKIVHGKPSSGLVHKSASEYDKIFKKGGKVEKSPRGFRLMNLEETYLFNLSEYDLSICTTKQRENKNVRTTTNS